MAGKLKLGIIGLGWPGGCALQAAAENKTKVVVSALADPVADRLKDRSAKVVEAGMPAPKTYTSANDLIADPEVDAVFIGLPNFLHAPVAVAALKAGKHVWSEKPPTINAKEAIQIYREATKRELIYQYVCQRRYNAQGQALRKAVESGQLGEVYHAKATWARSRGIPIGAGGWFVDKSRAGGGGIIDIGVHMLDAAWYYMGSPQPVSVSGQAVHKLSHLVPKKIKFDVDDFGIALIKFENGATILLEASWALNQRQERMDVSLHGTKAGAELGSGSLLSYDAKNQLVEKKLPLKKMKKSDYGVMCEHFIQCIAKGEEPISPAREAVQLMQMLDAVYESSATGKEVRIKPVTL